MSCLIQHGVKDLLLKIRFFSLCELAGGRYESVSTCFRDTYGGEGGVTRGPLYKIDSALIQANPTPARASQMYYRHSDSDRLPMLNPL